MTARINSIDFPVRYAQLKQELIGSAFLPGEDGYDRECRTYNLLTPLRPRAVIGAASATDVRAAVRFAADVGLGVAVRDGGHVVARPDPDVVVVNLTRMRSVSVDPDRRRVRFEGGALWQDVLDTVTPHGLAPMNGSSPAVGATGYVLAGGQSPLLGRSLGWAAEYVTSMDVVTADGRGRTVTAESAPDLFFALRGTKGNFGVVTAVEMEVFPVTGVYGGGLWFPGGNLAEVLGAWRTWVAGLPERMTTSIAIQRLPADPAPPGPALPEPLRGAFVVHLRTAYLGPAELAEKLLAPMRAAGPVILDTIAELYAEAATIHLDPPSPLPYVNRSAGLARLDQDTVDALVRVAGPGSGCELASIEIRQLGGALDRPPRTVDAIPARGLPFQLFAFGVGPAEQAPARRAELATLVDAVQPWADPRRMMAFLSPDEATDARAVRQLYGPERYDRLARIKRRYDPANRFRVNHNIEPAAADGR